MTNYHEDNWSIVLPTTKFAYNNTMHWSTNQTPFFANHDLHLKFNIQGANKIMKHVAKNKALFLEGI